MGFGAGNVLGATFFIFRRHFPPFVLMGGAIILPYFWVLFTRKDLAIPLHDFLPAIPPAISANLTLSRVIAFLLRSFSEITILVATFWIIGGQRIAWKTLPRIGLNRLLPVTVISICQSSVLLTGDAVLHMHVLPGWMASKTGTLFLALASLAITMPLYAAPPVAAIERLGVIASLRRSIALTQGHRLKLFGINMAIAAPGLAAGVLINRVLAATGSKILYAALEYGVQGIYVAFSTILCVVVYSDLRAEHVAAVFD